MSEPDAAALVEAARVGDLARVEELLARGVDAAAQVHDPARDGGVLTALGAAADGSHARIVQRLLEAGAGPGDITAINALTQRTEALDDEGFHCLELLCEAGQPGWILRVGLGQRLEVEDPRSVALLLAHGAPPDPPTGWGGSGGPLFTCIWKRRTAGVVGLLLDAGADARKTDRAGRTPWSLARRVHADALADELAARGHAITHDEGLDALLRSAWAGDVEDVGARLAAHPGPPARLRYDEHALLVHALEGDAPRPRVRALLAAGLDAGRPGSDGATVLHRATNAGDPALVRMLVDAGVRPDVRDHRGRTCLSIALANEARALAGDLLALEGIAWGETAGLPTGDPAFDARLTGAGCVAPPPDRDARFESARAALIDGRADALGRMLADDPGLARARSERTHHGTLLHYLGANGVENEHQRTPPNVVELVELLLAHGAEPDATCDTYGGGTAQTTLCLAASSDHPRTAGVQGELVAALVRGGAAVDGLRGDGEPLATAIAFRQLPAARALVAAGARVDNALFAAATGDPADVLALLDDGGGVRDGSPRCEVPWLFQHADPARAAGQALVVAAILGDATTVDALLARGVDPSAPLGAGNAGLHEAAYGGHAAVVTRLLDAGADAHRRDDQWHSSPLVWARAGGRQDVLDLLLERAGADLTDCADLGWTDRARALLDGGASPEGPRVDGRPLLFAVAEGHAEVVALLVEHGADPERLHEHGLTPLRLARRKRRDDLVKLLEARGGRSRSSR